MQEQEMGIETPSTNNAAAAIEKAVLRASGLDVPYEISYDQADATQSQEGALGQER
jgi:hypothetical protein